MKNVTLLLLFFCVYLSSCQKKVEEPIDLSGTWTMDLQLAGGVCDETLLEDEDGIPPTVRFNSDGTITFITDPVHSDLNNKSFFTNTYTLTDNILAIKIVYEDKTYNEKTDFEARLEYDAGSKKFIGGYTNTWGDGEVCANRLEIRK